MVMVSCNNKLISNIMDDLTGFAQMGVARVVTTAEHSQGSHFDQSHA